MAKRLGRFSVNNEPNWITGNSKILPDTGKSLAQSSYLSIPKPEGDKTTEEEPIQQSDLLKPLMLDIANFGLNYAYKNG